MILNQPRAPRSFPVDIPVHLQSFTYADTYTWYMVDGTWYMVPVYDMYMYMII